MGVSHAGQIAITLVLAAGLVPARARADERHTVLTAGVGVFLGLEDADAEGYPADPETRFAPRLTLAWEHAPLAYPAEPGYRFGVSLVPEVILGALVGGDAAESMIGVGARAELRLAQREQGLLRVSARGAAYLAARVFAVGETRDPLVEIAVGQYFVIRSRAHLGYDIGGFTRDGHGANTGGLSLSLVFGSSL